VGPGGIQVGPSGVMDNKTYNDLMNIIIKGIIINIDKFKYS